jgi:ATP/ADP translocase
VGFVMCGCFGNVCTCICCVLYSLYCVLYCLYCVLYCFVYVYLFLFVLSGLVSGLLPPNDNSTAVNNNNNNNKIHGAGKMYSRWMLNLSQLGYRVEGPGFD